MIDTAIDLVRNFPSIQVLVIGDALLDTYLEGEAARICREGPVPLLWKTKEQHNPGGAANVATNIKALNAHVSFLSVIGNDYAGTMLCNELQHVGIDTQWLLQDSLPLTPHKMHILAEGQYVIRLDDGARQDGTIRPSNKQLQVRFQQNLEDLYQQCDLVIVSDYNYGVISPPIIEQLEKLIRSNPKPVVIDSQALHHFPHFPATAITPNYQEAQRLIEHAGQEPSPSWQLLAQQVHAVLNVETVIITLANQGVFLQSRHGEGLHIPAHAVPTYLG